jgi:predicted DCC family thiol-disulfide oxidoreductase YuxK
MPSSTRDLMSDHTPIIFFDSECNLCNGFVDLVLRIDRQEIFKFAPLQGQTAKQFLPTLPINREEWSVFYLEGENLYSQSDAAIAVAARLGGVWSLLAIGGLLPIELRDPGYRLLASNRYRWFGRSSSCRISSDAEKSRFLV